MPANPVLDVRALLDRRPVPMPAPGLFTAARWALIHWLRFRGVREVALPDYMCDEVARALRAEGFAVSFYGLDDSLEPLPTEPRRGSALVVAHFYGRLSRGLPAAAARCRERGALLVEDRAHLPYPHGLEGEPLADAALYSLRKCYPCPAGAIVALREGQEDFARAVRAAGPRVQGWDGGRLGWALRQAAKGALQLTGLHYRTEYRDLSSDPLAAEQLARGLDWLVTRRLYENAVERRRANARLYAERAAGWGSFAQALGFDLSRDVPYQFPVILRPGLQPLGLVRRLVDRGLPACLGLALDDEVSRKLGPEHRYKRVLALPVHQSLGAEEIMAIAAALERLHG